MTLSTDSSSSVRLGAQEPRVLTRPDFVHCDPAEECIELAESCGVMLDPWQQLCIRVILAVNGAGRMAALEAAILVARQNGKGEVLLALSLYWLFVSRDRLVVHTAHEFKTAAEAFLKLKAVIDNNPFLQARIRTERTSHGEEGYTTVWGNRIRYLARSRSSGRGFTGDKVILDEAQELPTLAMDALMPTLSSRPDPQLVYAGTVPSAQNDAEHWTKIMNRGRLGKSKRLAWMEWNGGERLAREALYSGEDPALIAKAEAAMLEYAYAANPALGIRLGIDFLETERESLSWAGYLRERLNLWSLDPVSMVIDMATWLGLVDESSALDDQRPMALGVDCPPGMARTSICAMGFGRQHGVWHGELVEQHSGTEWVPVRVAELVRKNESIGAVVIDPGAPAGALIQDIEAEGVQVLQVSSRQHAQACGMLYTRCVAQDEDGALRRSFRHLGDPILTEALKVAVKRPGPDGAWLWNRRDSGDDISPIVALTLAGFGLSSLAEAESEPWGFWS